MTRVLFRVASMIVLTRVPYKRSASPEELLAASPPLKGRVLLEPDTRKAVQSGLGRFRRPHARRHRRLALFDRRSQTPEAVLSGGSGFPAFSRQLLVERACYWFYILVLLCRAN